MKAILLCAMSLIFFTSNLSLGQIKWNLNLEAGSYTANNTILKEERDFSIRAEGEFKYNYETPDSKAFLQLQARPEVLGVLNKLNTIKLRAAGGFFQYYDNYDLGINFSAQNHNYSGEVIAANLTSYFLRANYSQLLSDEISAEPAFGYAYQNVDFNGRRTTDTYFADIKVEQAFNQYFRLGYGIYGEKFTLVNKFNFFNLSRDNSNSGLRIGPQISLYYLSGFMLNSEIKFLFHKSDLTDFPSYEALIRFAGGKLLATDFTLLLLIDFYTRKFSYKNPKNENSNLLYTPINIENRFYLKLSYDADDHWEIFSKAGYSKEYLYDRDLSLSGWNISIGLSLTN